VTSHAQREGRARHAAGMQADKPVPRSAYDTCHVAAPVQSERKLREGVLPPAVASRCPQKCAAVIATFVRRREKQPEYAAPCCIGRCYYGVATEAQHTIGAAK